MAKRLMHVSHAREVWGLELNSWTGKILHSIANGLSPLQHLRKSSRVALVLWHEMDIANSYATASYS